MHPEILERQSRLQNLFDEVGRLKESGSIGTDIAVQLTWYLCIRTSGFLENSVQLILLEYVQSQTTDVSTLRYVDDSLKRISARYDHIMRVVRSFNEDWRTILRREDIQELKHSLDNMVENRNHIAHGRDVNVTLQELQGYFKDAQKVVEMLHKTCDTQNGHAADE